MEDKMGGTGGEICQNRLYEHMKFSKNEYKYYQKYTYIL